jgi:hypothetical protein
MPFFPEIWFEKNEQVKKVFWILVVAMVGLAPVRFVDAPELTPQRDAKLTNHRSGESEPLVRRANESLSVRHEYDQQRRTRCGAWCEERAGVASPAASLRAQGCVIVCPINREKIAT